MSWLSGVYRTVRLGSYAMSIGLSFALQHRFARNGAKDIRLQSSLVLPVGFNRVSTAIQLTSHVLPPSSEKACSNRHETGVMSDQMLRTRIILPLNISWS